MQHAVGGPRNYRVFGTQAIHQGETTGKNLISG